MLIHFIKKKDQKKIILLPLKFRQSSKEKSKGKRR